MKTHLSKSVCDARHGKGSLPNGVSSSLGWAHGLLAQRRGFLLAAGLCVASCGDPGDMSLEDGEPVASVGEAALINCTPPSTISCPPPPPNSGVKITCFCLPPPPPPAQNFNLIPDFYVTHVVYAPPGTSSSITYSSSSSVGSSSSISNGIKDEVSVKAEASGSFFGSADVTVTAGLETETSRTDDLEVSVERSHDYTSWGQVDRVDHNYDEIWILIRPRINVMYQPAGSIPSQTARMTWKFGVQDGINYGIPMKIYAGWLNGALPMDSGVRQTLDFYGITSDKYAALLSANPLFTGTTPNMTMDPGRYEFVGVFPYVPPFSAGGGMASTQTYSIERTSTTTSTWSSSTDISVGISAEGGFNIGVFSAKLEVAGKWTWSHSADFSNSTGTGATDTFTVGQPSFGYTGPTLLRVYKDKIFGTYAFTLDWPQGETNLALNRAAWQSSELPGWGAVASRGNDGNTSGSMWDESVMHTDWGFTGWGGEGWPGQYWGVDLGAERVVNSIKIFNRTDCCSERLSNYNVLAYDSMQHLWKVIVDRSVSDTSGVSFIELPVEEMVRTQHVMVAKTDENYLHLAEVQVIGF